MILNQRGMSLVSVLMAIGLTGVLSLILMSQMEQQQKIQKRAFLDGEMTEVFAQFVNVINAKSSCGATFTGLQKGDTINEFRYSFDPNQEPFAEVGTPFRGTKLVLREMKILTDAEVQAKGLPTTGLSGSSTVVLRVTLERPPGTLGGQFISKIFDVRVSMGLGQILQADASVIEQQCRDATGGNGCIANFETGVCADVVNDQLIPLVPPEAGGDLGEVMGYCFDENPPTATDNIIVRCTVTN